MKGGLKMDKTKRWKIAAIAMAVILAVIGIYTGISYANYQVASYGFSQGVNSTINQGTQALLQQGYISWPVPYFNQTTSQNQIIAVRLITETTCQQLCQNQASS